jgi:hypothetical protein
MTKNHLWQRAQHAWWEAQVLWVAAQEVQVKVQQTCLTLLQQRYDGRLRREGEHLRRLMPDAHRWTIEITAQILVARGLDTGTGGTRRPSERIVHQKAGRRQDHRGDRAALGYGL